MNCTTTYCRYAYMAECDIQAVWLTLPVTRIYSPLVQESKIQCLLGTVHNTEWMDHREVCHGRFEDIPILDSLDVETTCSYSSPC
jgi:hypothetical protein